MEHLMLTRRSILLSLAAPKRRKALVIDGRNNHDWRATTPVLTRILRDASQFDLEVYTAKEGKGPVQDFTPQFAPYDVVVLNYSDYDNGGVWPTDVKRQFERYVHSGGGVVIVHAAAASFPEWPAYNQMIGLGGWGGRDEKSGPLIRFRDGKMVRDPKPGKAGHHGKRHPYMVTVRDPHHPATAGLPLTWMHSRDELYDSLRGPAKHLHLLATAYSDPAMGGTGEHEPVLFTVRFGRGRIFHTVLGHDAEGMSSEGYALSFAKGTAWAAS